MLVARERAAWVIATHRFIEVSWGSRRRGRNVLTLCQPLK
jgi:hypothetical protein